MKRTVGIVVGLVTVGVAIYVGSRLLAQTAPAFNAGQHPATNSPKTRVALLNLKYVVMNYQKFKDFNERLKSEYQGYDKQEQDLNAKLEGLKKDLSKQPPLPEADRAAKEREATQTQRQMQDIADEAKKVLGKKEADELVVIYKEVATAVSRYASSNDIDLVMHFNDGTTPAEMESAPNIQRKMMTGPCIPIYYNQSVVDISYPVWQMLNQSYTQQNPAPAAAGTPAAGQPAH